MKNKLFKIIALIAIIGFSFAALSLTGCGGGSGGGSGGDDDGSDYYSGNGGNPDGGQLPGTPGGEQPPPDDSVQGNTLAEQLAWLQSNAKSDTAYTLIARADEDLDAHLLSYNNRSNITITLKGSGGEKVIRQAGNYFFWIYGGVTLVLDENITLQSNQSNTAIYMYDGELVMNDGAKINGSRFSVSFVSNQVSNQGGNFTMNGGEISGYTINGVNISRENVIFTMNGGTISSNNNGGDPVTGVSVYSNSTFTMNGGTISGNNRGVVIGSDVNNTGIFTMNGGEISGNIRVGRNSDGCGVIVNGTFTMSGGTISGNGGSTNGGVIMGSGTFTMTDGIISGNTATGYGGGVIVGDKVTFTMSGGTISGNTATVGGGGVYNAGYFTMNGGIISGNTAEFGGGVCGDAFTQNGGTISGNTATGHVYYNGVRLSDAGNDIYRL